MNVVTLKPHRYRSKLREVGEEYEIAARADVRLFKALGWVIEAPEKVATHVIPVKVVRVPFVEIAAPVAEVPVEVIAPETEAEPLPVAETVQSDIDANKPKRAYKRRDLSAQ